jgi:hypothetical protein
MLKQATKTIQMHRSVLLCFNVEDLETVKWSLQEASTWPGMFGEYNILCVLLSGLSLTFM